MKKKIDKKRVFSGIQPSGNLHVGNYLGAIKHWVESQDTRDNFICIVDLHAITVSQVPESLALQTRQLGALLFACGIDPQKTTLFVQSQVPAHAEAAWILGCITPLGWLERMTQFKTKAATQESVLSGLLTYPVLQAADILLYDADEVPVGEDQKQHIELCRDIAQRFNHLYGHTFVVPDPVIPKAGARIMGLDDPTTKMSKSEGARGHAVRLMDSDEEIRWALKRAVTDSGREIEFSDAPEKAGVNNLLVIYQALTGKAQGEVLEDFRDARGYGDLKERVAEAAIEVVRPIRTRYQQFMAEPDELNRLLAIGAERAHGVADPKIAEIKRKVGLVSP